MKKITILLFTMLLISASVFCQVGQVFNSVNSGLPDDDVVDSYLASNGDLWFGTKQGLAKYDGENWATYSWQDLGAPMQFLWVSGFGETSDGTIYVGAMTGLYALKGDTWVRYFKENSGLFDDLITYMINGKDDDFWIGTQSGLLHFKPAAGEEDDLWESWTPENSNIPGAKVGGMDYKSDGTMVVSTVSGVVTFDGTTFSDVLCPVMFNAVVDENDKIWAGDYGDGLFTVDSEGVQENMTIENSLLPFDFVTFMFDVENSEIGKGVWFSMDSTYFEVRGIAKVDGDSYVRFNTETGMPGEEVMSVVFKNENEAYFAVKGKGVKKVDFTQSPLISLPSSLLEGTVEENTTGLVDYNVKNLGGGQMSYTVVIPQNTPWLSIENPTGVIEGESEGTLQFKFDATGLAHGTFESEIRVVSNGGIAYVKVKIVVTKYDGVHELIDSSIAMYPNPVIDVLNVVSEKDVIEISVFDIQGRRVSQIFDFTGDKLDMTELTVGQYIVKTRTEDGISSRLINKL